jgi:hypothetical protein
MCTNDERKIRVFIGSSTEGLSVADSLVAQLTGRGYYVKVWDEGVFTLGNYNIESLMQIVNEKFDFAIFVFTADDKACFRGNTVFLPRDNVIFEMGMFMSRLDRNRTLFICETGLENEVKILSDMSGLVPATFTKSNSGSDLRTDLRPAIVQLCDAMEKRGIIRESGSYSFKHDEIASHIRAYISSCIDNRPKNPDVIIYAMDTRITIVGITLVLDIVKNVNVRVLAYDKQGEYNTAKGQRGFISSHFDVAVDDLTNYEATLKERSNSVELRCSKSLYPFQGILIDDKLYANWACWNDKGELYIDKNVREYIIGYHGNSEFDIAFIESFRTWHNYYWNAAVRIFPECVSDV